MAGTKLIKLSRLSWFKMRAVAVVAAVALLGYVVTRSWAAGPLAALEAESGTTAAGATVAAQTGASGGSVVTFATGATPTPAPTTTPTSQPSADVCATSPALPTAKPTAANTGIPAGTTLTASGDINATTAGQVISAKNITGGITVSANNVTIQNSRITQGGYWAIRVMDGVTGTRILHNEITSPSGAYTGILATDAFICSNYITGFENTITAGANTTIQANFIEKLLSDSPSAHYDGIEVYSGNNTKIWGNNIMLTDASGAWRGETGAINITATWSNMNAIDVNGNWVGGGSYTVYVDEQGFNVTNATFTNNTWYGTSPAGHATYGPALIRDNSSVTSWSGNTWENGAVISN